MGAISRFWERSSPARLSNDHNPGAIKASNKNMKIYHVLIHEETKKELSEKIISHSREASAGATLVGINSGEGEVQDVIVPGSINSGELYNLSMTSEGCGK